MLSTPSRGCGIGRGTYLLAKIVAVQGKLVPETLSSVNVNMANCSSSYYRPQREVHPVVYSCWDIQYPRSSGMQVAE